MVLYIDLLTQLDILLPVEVQYIDGKIDDRQLHQYHQDIIQGTALLFSPGFIDKAFQDTNLILDQRLSPHHSGMD